MSRIKIKIFLLLLSFHSISSQFFNSRELDFDIENSGRTVLDLGEMKSQRSNLAHVKAFNNKIASIGSETFQNATNLKSIDLSRNLLTDIPIGTFTGLIILNLLYLGENHLTSLNVGVFEPLQNLHKIDLQMNKITVLEDGTFLKNPNLIQVNLNQNKIIAIGSYSLDFNNVDVGLMNNFCADLFFYHSPAGYDSLNFRTKCFQIYPVYKENIARIIETSNSDCNEGKSQLQANIKNCQQELKSIQKNLSYVTWNQKNCDKTLMDTQELINRMKQEAIECAKSKKNLEAEISRKSREQTALSSNLTSCLNQKTLLEQEARNRNMDLTTESPREFEITLEPQPELEPEAEPEPKPETAAEPETFDWKLISIVLGILLMISILIHLVVCIQSRKSRGSENFKKCDSHVSYYPTVPANSEKGRNFVPKSKNNRVVDENCQDIEMRDLEELSEHVYESVYEFRG